MDWLRSRRASFSTAITLVLIAAAAKKAHADALVVTRAMQASTIAEIFIDEKQIRVEIEVGVADAIAFANVLPDELHEEVTGHARPFKDRVRTFFESDWIVQADGQPLRGELERVIPAKRVVRDDVTGEALADQPADADSVIRVVLRYELNKLNDRPQSLTIRSPQAGANAAANVGFVCYHDGLPVNDFRYMAGEVTLDLDWADPWYSRFRNPNLRRQFDAPLSAYLYIEPYEVRKEIIVRPKDLQMWLELDIHDDGVIPVDQQEQLKRRVAAFLAEVNPVTIDGRTAQGRLDRIHFIHRSLRTTGVIEPPVDLDVTSATLGVIFVYPVEKWPDEVSVKWELFSPRIQAIPAVASDEAGGLPSTLTPDEPLLVWKNFLTNPTTPTMIAVAVPAAPMISIPVISVVCLVLLLLLSGGLFRAMKRDGPSTVMLVALAATVAIGVMCLPYARASLPSPMARSPVLPSGQAKNVLHALLHNVYRAFDRHDESLVYDRLALSISGDLLREVYLKLRRSIELENQGGARVKVDDVTVLSVAPQSESNRPRLIYRCRWTAAGSVGHWGHIHRRVHLYDAVITIEPAEGVWKITEIDLRQEQRAEPGTPNQIPNETPGNRVDVDPS